MKCYFILLEDNKYSTNYMIHMTISELNKRFHDESSRERWIKNNSQIQIRMIYNLNSLYLFEEYCINNGLYFRWIKDGILVEPTEHKLSNILNDTLYFKQYENVRIN